MLEKIARGCESHTFIRPGFYRQMSTLLWRDAVVAARDPTLYYLQVSKCLSSNTVGWFHSNWKLFTNCRFWFCSTFFLWVPPSRRAGAGDYDRIGLEVCSRGFCNHSSSLKVVFHAVHDTSYNARWRLATHRSPLLWIPPLCPPHCLIETASVASHLRAFGRVDVLAHPNDPRRPKHRAWFVVRVVDHAPVLHTRLQGETAAFACHTCSRVTTPSKKTSGRERTKTEKGQ